MEISIVTRQELSKLLLDPSKQAGKDYLIVDVRDADHEGGHITSSVNYPSSTFLARVDELVKQSGPVKQIFFHCMLSQNRGPSCARKYVRRLEELGQLATHQKVHVLEGGFHSWQAHYRTIPDMKARLISDFDEERWSDDKWFY